jgi:hypothetical protein
MSTIGIVADDGGLVLNLDGRDVRNAFRVDKEGTAVALTLILILILYPSTWETFLPCCVAPG